MANRYSYDRLSTAENDELERSLSDEEDKVLPRATVRTDNTQLTTFKWLLGVSFLGNAILLAATLWNNSHDSLGNTRFPQALYSPAQVAIEYEIKKVVRGFDDEKTIYQLEPSPEVDEAWENLYEPFAMSRIPKEQAALLPNKTYPYVRDDGYYAISLMVFHSLHCLNRIRKSLYPEIYPPDDVFEGNLTLRHEHTTHCIDSIRQSLMCASDVSPVVWQWSDWFGKARPQPDIVRVCRNHDKIVEWALENKAITELDVMTYVDDDLDIPEF